MCVLVPNMCVCVAWMRTRAGIEAGMKWLVSDVCVCVGVCVRVLMCVCVLVRAHTHMCVHMHVCMCHADAFMCRYRGRHEMAHL